MPSKKQQKIAELDKIIGISNDLIEETDEEIVSEPKKLPVVENVESELVVQTEGGKDIAALSDENFIKDLKNDYRDTRRMLKILILKGETALDGIMLVADESEHPRAYEVASTLIKTISDVSNNLIELQKTVRALSGTRGEGGQPAGDIPAPEGSSNNPNVGFVGSFNDLLNMMNEVDEKRELEKNTIDGEIVNKT